MNLLKIHGKTIDGVGNWCLDDIDKLWRFERPIYINTSEISTIKEINEDDPYDRNKTYHAYIITMKNGTNILTKSNLSEVLENGK